MPRDVQLIVEDELSGAVLRKIIEQSSNDLSVSDVQPMRGSGNIRNKLQRFKNASNVIPHIVLTDLDQYDCAPTLMMDWGVSASAQNFLFRVAVREVEAWILADREGVAGYLNIPLTKIPLYPEQENDPKQTFFNLVRKCRKRKLINELVPATGSSASIGPLYNPRMGEFVRGCWSIERAIKNSDSLFRAVERVSTF